MVQREALDGLASHECTHRHRHRRSSPVSEILMSFTDRRRYLLVVDIDVDDLIFLIRVISVLEPGFKFMQATFEYIERFFSH